MKNLKVLKKGYEAFAKGNVEKVVKHWAKDIEWIACTGLPMIKGDGIYKGVQEVTEGVLAKIPEYYEDFKIEVTDFIDGGKKIVMAGYYTGVWKATGKRFKANATHVWTFRKGKAIRFFQAVDTAEITGPVYDAEPEKEMDTVI